MSDQKPPATGSSQQSTLIIPDEVRAAFAEIIELILASESMNDEERQYWINILPIMTPDQLQNLETILQNEREQLSAIDKKYSKEIAQIGQEKLVAQTAAERRARRAELEKTEERTEKTEEKIAEELLAQIEKEGSV